MCICVVVADGSLFFMLCHLVVGEDSLLCEKESEHELDKKRAMNV